MPTHRLFSEPYGISAVYEIAGLKHSARARKTLDYLKQHIASLCVKHSWRVEELREIHPTDPEMVSVLGLNVGRGQAIHLRLRKNQKPNEFLSDEDVMQTLLHELAHMAHDGHTSDFHRLLADLQDEWQRLRRRTTDSRPDNYPGNPNSLVSGDEPIARPSKRTREKCAEAAQRRQRVAKQEENSVSNNLYSYEGVDES